MQRGSRCNKVQDLADLTGFSILSGVEIIYYAIRFFASLRVRNADVAAAAKEKFRNHLT